jgi:hypothetical protein
MALSLYCQWNEKNQTIATHTLKARRVCTDENVICTARKLLKTMDTEVFSRMRFISTTILNSVISRTHPHTRRNARKEDGFDRKISQPDVNRLDGNWIDARSSIDSDSVPLQRIVLESGTTLGEGGNGSSEGCDGCNPANVRIKRNRTRISSAAAAPLGGY